MKHKFLVFLLFFSCFCHAQTDIEFWFAAPYMSVHCNYYSEIASLHFRIFSYDTLAHVTVEMPANPSFTPINRTITKDGYADITLTTTYQGAIDSVYVPFHTISQRGFRITSDAKVGCYYQITGANGEAFTLKGHNALGTDFVVGMQNTYTVSQYTDAFSNVQIVATENNTTVTISPTANQGTNCDTQPYNVVLNRGETYAFRACSAAASDHLIGSVIHSDKNIAVTTNDDSASPNGGNCDDVGEQLVPNNMLGTEYIVMSQNNDYDYCYIIALENNTHIALSNGQTFTLNKGQVKSISLHLINILYIKGDNPFEVFQLTGLNGELGGTVLPHIQCTGSRDASYIRIPNSSTCMFHILTESTNTSDIIIDGVPLDSTNFQFVPGTNNEWSFAIINATSYPTDRPIRVHCNQGLFQLGVLDNNSYSGTCTYGYFSDYGIDHIVDEYATIPAHATYTWEGHYNADSTVMQFSVTGVYTDRHSDVNGCDSTFMLHLTVDFTCDDYPPTILDTVISICQGDTFYWNQRAYTESTTISDTITAITTGCDSIISNIQLRVLPRPDITVSPDTIIHMGDTYTLWATGADYYVWSPGADLSDSTESTIQVSPTRSTVYTVTAYNGITTSENLVYNGDFELGNEGFLTEYTYTAPYNYNDFGYYTIAPTCAALWPIGDAYAYGGSGNYMVVDGKESPNTLVWGQNIPVTPNTYYVFSTEFVSLHASNEYSQYAYLQFKINDSQIGPIVHSPNILNLWVPFYDTWYSGADTIARLQIVNQNSNGAGNDFGIDHIAFRALPECGTSKTVIVAVEQQSHTDTTLCQSQLGFRWNNIYVNQAGLFRDTILSSSGIRDSIITLRVLVTPSVDTLLYDTACYSYQFAGRTYYQSGTYNDTLQSLRTGCDSIVRMQLTILPTYDIQLSASICQGETYTLNGFNESKAGVYTKTLQSVHGCDSIVHLNLSVHPLYDTTIVARICERDRYTLNGFDENQPGTYTHNLQSVFGCDSVVHLQLSVDTVPRVDYAQSICLGETYRWHDMEYTQAGTYYYEEPTTDNQCGTNYHVLTLTVFPQLAIQMESEELAFCADEKGITIPFTTTSGIAVSYDYTIYDPQHNSVLSKSNVRISQPEFYLEQWPSNIWPGTYDLEVTFHDSLCADLQKNVTLKVEYTSDSVITQRWNDFLSVRQTAYKFYEGFDSYQWYKDGVMLASETNPQYYVPQTGLGNSYYAVELTRSKDGVKMMSCPFYPTDQPKTVTLVITPTSLSASRRPMMNVTVDQPSQMTIYHETGAVHSVHSLADGVNTVQGPSLPGIYMVHIETMDGGVKNQKIIVTE